MIRLVLFLALMLPAAVQAGPWPREAGRTFLSLSGERNRADSSYASAYAEYGLTPRTTLGMELGRADQAETSAVLWLQRALDDGQGPNRFAMQSGAGVIRRDDLALPVVQGALSWGRGFDRGWITAQVLAKMTGSAPDPRAPMRPSFAASFLTAERVIKTDVTLGLRPRDGLMVINSLWLEHPQDEEYSARLMSSLVFDVPGPVKVELGMVNPLSGPSEQAVRLGTWLEF
ncbi:hypothetical protein [Paracoccus haeundaensis]|uniref:DUF481 domain-containing protein n=1 Tax=Paracoccus haeundaensis TaxID=225362 RepID=A0A5C4R9G7_9RHOB|nr:hypothetical protein [Paracoccus haeundaensis]TNH40590.1 hypothetical protein FHD67_02945 [Paracoccus haeundaensis]